ncbi:VanW family protein [Deinococcus psychrotolerans]|uniref:VanW family protein n=1 Tax=Deinococcus psychrotolerans TaxID=2489213 RepID=UPI001F1534D6|nr:VanW family protein [Deinococcus psychrotolerans]
MKKPFAAWPLTALGVFGLSLALSAPSAGQSGQIFQLQVTAPEPLLVGGQVTRPLVNRAFELRLSAEQVAALRKGELSSAALKKVYRQIETRTPKNAFFQQVGGKWAAQGQTGWQVERTATQRALQKAAQQRQSNVPVSLTLQAPPRSVRVLQERGVVAHVVTGTSSFVGSPDFRVHNIRVGSAKLNGSWLERGAVFNFNAKLGNISSASGFVPGYIISGGSLALEDGGGVCQISTTLFRAAYLAGLPLVERHAHSHQVAYYDPPGFEATVYAPSKNLRFRNDTAAPLLIQASWDLKAQTLRFDFFGAAPDRRVQVSAPKLSDRKPASNPTYMADPKLKAGEIERVDLPASGVRVAIVRTITRIGKDTGKAEQTDVLRSTYRPWGGTFAVSPSDKRLRR